MDLSPTPPPREFSHFSPCPTALYFYIIFILSLSLTLSLSLSLPPPTLPLSLSLYIYPHPKSHAATLPYPAYERGPVTASSLNEQSDVTI